MHNNAAIPWGCVDKETFDGLKKRWEKQKKEHPKLSFIDEHLRRTIVLLNRIPGVVTTFCCSGHPTENPAERCAPYIVTACKKNGFNTIRQICYNFTELVEKYNATKKDVRYVMQMELSQLILPEFDKPIWYPTVTLRIAVATTRDDAIRDYPYTVICRMLESAVLMEMRE